jgi:hypothetical protein
MGTSNFRISDCESRIEFEEGLDGELNANPQFEFRNPQFFDAVYLPMKMI